MEFAFKPLNHLIAIRAILDGKILHIKDSSLEWTTIFWLKWLTCSTESIQPLQREKVGWWNRRGRLAPSMLRVKGELATWLSASFMALFPSPLWVGLLFLRLWRYSSSPKKVSLGGVLDLRLYITSFVSSDDSSESGDECLRRTRRNFFFNSSISRCMSLSLFAWETWLLPREWLLLVCVICTFPSWSPLSWGFATESLCWDPPNSAWCRLASS